MDGMNNDAHMHGMGGMTPSSPAMNGSGMSGMHHHMMMHMTFFWGSKAEILFSGWPGTRSGMYVLALIFVFALAVLAEWLSHCNLIKDGSNHVAAGLIQTVVHAVRVGLAYLVMLAVMSFNGGVFLVAIAGHTLGFLLFGSRLFKRSPPPPPPSGKTADLPPMSC
uniref:Copper transport protein n=1 Tax=Davidia involucrata TaxID=16924 RepID=A0A5B7BWK0_DAVIN